MRLQLETLEDRVVPSAAITLPLVNQTGLPAQYSIYVLGYGSGNMNTGGNVPPMELQSNGQFAPFPSASGTIPSYNISSMPPITLDQNTPVVGGRLYFFVVPNNQSPPTFAYSNNGSNVTQPTNPPNSNDPPFDIVEITQPAGGLPTIDVQTVDGFIFPLTLTLNSNQGQVGQPLTNSTVNRADILNAYTTFMNAQGAAGTPYQALMFGPNSIAGQDGGIVNPGSYLAAGANSSSALNTVWNSAIATLFQTPGRTLSMIGDDGDYYVGTPLQVGSSWVLHFVGYTNATQTTTNGNVFNIYSPLTPDPLGAYQANETAGEMVFANDGVFNDTSTNVMLAQNGSSNPTPSQVALGLERDIVAALNRGVALLGPTDGLNGDDSTYWGTETNWYPAGQTENLFSLFMHTGTVNGTPIFVLPSGAVKDAQGTLMGSAYGFAFDENPTHGPPGQPNVPSKFDPVPTGTTSVTITLGPWLATSTTPPSSPNGTTSLLFLAQDEFALVVDSVLSRFSNDPLFTQAADRMMSFLDDLFHLHNPALYTGLSGLQSAINSNPYQGTLSGFMGEAIGLEWAANMLTPPNPS
jgi:hypothetical protein